MSFEHEGLAFNLLDTPGHQDFSPLGFQRGHLPHLDRGRQRGDGARRRPQWRQGGVEKQTRKLFEVCRLRDEPIITFVNKLGREGRDPFDLLDEIEQSLALGVTPASWPIGMGRDFLGMTSSRMRSFFERGVYDRTVETLPKPVPSSANPDRTKFFWQCELAHNCSVLIRSTFGN